MSKKVIIFIVEGDSDETLLIDRMKKLYGGYEVRFESQHGDIFFDIKRTKNIKNVIGNTVKSIIQKRKFKEKDILAVIHLMDTDGCLIPDEYVRINVSQAVLTFYTSECINVIDERQRGNIISRNNERSINVKTMNCVDSIVSGKFKYQLYYFSRNLEHVIFNEPNPDGEGKVEDVEMFLATLEGHIDEYLDQYLNVLRSTEYETRYRESWVIISEGTQSLNRSTNVPLMFDYIRNAVQSTK